MLLFPFGTCFGDRSINGLQPPGVSSTRKKKSVKTQKLINENI